MVSARGPSSLLKTVVRSAACAPFMDERLDFDRHDLVVELAFGLRLQRVLMAAIGERVLILARDVVLAAAAARR